MISGETIEEIKDKAKLLDVAGEYVELKRQGARFVACCPFHSEKTPSFHIRPDQNTYHCFGCGVSGNVISFLMQVRGLSFPEAVEELAARYNIAVRQESGGVRKESAGALKNDLYKVNLLAAAFFVNQFRGAPGEAIAYLKERALSKEAIREFGIGFAPSGRDVLAQHLRKQKVSDDLISKAGLCRRNESGEVYDTFRSRLMFPVRSDPKRVVAFGGRIIPALITRKDSNIPKYINSPETAVYEKNKTLFGLPQALPAVRAAKEIFVVEGYLDVIGLWQAGVRNCVATCGTALTAGHTERLARVSRKVVLLFDGDTAGREAAAKCFPLFLNTGVEVKAVFLDAADDPDTVARRLGPGTGEYLAELQRFDLLDCFVDMQARRYGVDLHKGEGGLSVGEISKEVALVLREINDPIVRDRMTERTAFRLRVKSKLLRESVEDPSGKVPAIEVDLSHESPETIPMDASIVPVQQLDRTEQELLSAIMVHRELSGEVLENPGICPLLSPSVLLFAHGFAQVLEQSEEIQKSETKRLLQRFGKSWIEHWKKSYDMASRSEVNMKAAYQDCIAGLKIRRIQAAIDELTGMRSDTDDEGVQAALSNQILQLRQQMEEIRKEQGKR